MSSDLPNGKKESIADHFIPDDGNEASTDGSTKREPRKPEGNILVLATFILEVIIVAFVVVLAYFLRWTTIFPVRKQNFSCSDPEINFRLEESAFSNFAFEASVSDSAIYALSFCVPLFVIIVGEIGVWAFSEDKQKFIRVCCPTFKVPQVMRRLLRFIGVFIFGAFIVLVFCDVMKMMTGRLRPNFLELCKVNLTQCAVQGGSGSDELCTETDAAVLRYARTSFPSLFSALSAYSAIYISLYIHGALRTRSVRVLRPFLALAFVVLALLCGLMEVGLHTSHPLDVIAGLLLGVVLAFYLGAIVLNNFKEHIPEKIVLSLLHRFLLDNQILEELMKESGQKLPFKIIKDQDFLLDSYIPRARASFKKSNSETDDSDDTKQRALMYDSFQKDISKTVDHYRERRNSIKELSAQTAQC